MIKKNIYLLFCLLFCLMFVWCFNFSWRIDRHYVLIVLDTPLNYFCVLSKERFPILHLLRCLFVILAIRLLHSLCRNICLAQARTHRAIPPFLFLSFGCLVGLWSCVYQLKLDYVSGPLLSVFYSISFQIISIAAFPPDGGPGPHVCVQGRAIRPVPGGPPGAHPHDLRHCPSWMTQMGFKC